MSASLEYLLNRYANKTCTVEEKEELMRLLQESGNDEALQQLIDKMLEERPVIHTMPEKNAQAVLQAIFEADETPVVQIDETPVRSISFGRIAAAASVLLLLTAAGWFMLNRSVKPGVTTAAVMKNDVAPGGSKALLTLADGSTIVLDNAANGVVAEEGNATVVKLKNGQLVYKTDKGKAAGKQGEVAYNTLSTPKGGEYKIVLPDGSEVWLNAQSSITYPTTFNAKERKVQVTGEAYFEVAKLVTVKDGKRVPFLVDIKNRKTGGDMGQVQVLGTHFNINAYDDEKAVKTTLLEGKVKFVTTPNTSAKDTASAILSPGEQAVVHGDVQVKKVDVNNVMAWKNGVFHFEKADIQTVMRQLSRWYDVEVVYKRDIEKDDPLFFEVKRNTNLSDVLKVLNLANGAKFSIEDKKIIVL
ncbi:FecR family protein [Niastella sp. OAS944]|uniref:FecR family protein n=1 Tax=Niastella sp. OAS944 TaxID=2664089 RepID=UPI0034732B75|nr:ferric-dicitrate binding protein FerR (iron transport regulator) [Chitinophagaceae bacterium OAS944]